MEPNSYQYEKNENTPLKTLYQNPGVQQWGPEARYRNRYLETIGTEARIPKPGLNLKISTVPGLLYTLNTMTFIITNFRYFPLFAVANFKGS